MSKLKSLLAKETTAWVEYPEIEGFEIHLRFLTKEDLLKIRNASLVIKFSKKTRQREEDIDSNKFLQHYAEKGILDWRGLKIKHLPSLIPVDMAGVNPEEEIPFDIDDAVELLKNSSSFDQFVTDSMNDFEQFSKNKSDEDVKN